MLMPTTLVESSTSMSKDLEYSQSTIIKVQTISLAIFKQVKGLSPILKKYNTLL